MLLLVEWPDTVLAGSRGNPVEVLEEGDSMKDESTPVGCELR